MTPATSATPAAPARMRQQQAAPAAVTRIDGTDITSGPRVCDDMTVEVALSVMAGARVDHLILCDGDDQCTGSVTRAELAVLRDSPTYTDRVRLRDVLSEPFTSPGARSVTVLRHGPGLGVLPLSA